MVAIEGATERSDGSTYHVTWSLDRARGRVPKDSNRMIAEQGWDALAEPIPVTLVPARF